MGVVYRAHDDHLDRDVAIKVLPPGALANEEARKRFRKEALALSRLNQANIATVHDFDTENGTDYLVMEFVPGKTLSERTADGPMPEKEILGLAVQLTQGLTSAHKQGVVHCDLKPANLRITPDGTLKILDFGLAQLIEAVGDSAVTRSAREPTLAGTLAYMAPEQAGGGQVDARTDIYASGAVLYEMATGKQLFKASSPAALLGAVLNQPITPPRQLNPSLSTELERIILKCLEKDPENRYQSVKELAVDLRRLLSPSVVAALPRPARRTRHTAVLTGALAVAVVALALFAAQYLRDRRAAVAGAGAIRSLAVLPLDDFSASAGQEFFAEGMTDELISALAQIGELRVISRTSVAQYKGTKKTLPQIARELKVDAIIQGSVQRVGERVRIRAQLIRAATEQHLWTKDYDGKMRDVLALESQVARAIAEQVQAKLTQDENRRLAQAHSVSPEAYDAYLRGSYFLDRGEFDKSIEYFNQAIRADSNYAQPYARRALAYYFQGFFGMLPPAEAFGKMRESAEMALQKDDSLAEAHGALALVKVHYDWDWAGAEKEFRRALELNPNSADIRHDYAHYLNTIGRLEESAAETKAALERDPAGVMLMSCVCWHHYSARHYDQALAQSNQALKMEPNFNWTHTIRGWAFEEKQQFKDAIAEFKLALTMGMGGGDKPMAAEEPAVMKNAAMASKPMPAPKPMAMNTAGQAMGTEKSGAMDMGGMSKPMPPMKPAQKPAPMMEKMGGMEPMALTLASLGHAYALAGQRAEAQAILAALLQRRQKGYVSAFDLAVLYTGLGEKQQALDWLEKAYQERSAFLIYMTWEPRLDPLRNEPRFQDIIRKVGFPAAALR
jgi:TolB-like protein